MSEHPILSRYEDLFYKHNNQSDWQEGPLTDEEAEEMNKLEEQIKNALEFNTPENNEIVIKSHTSHFLVPISEHNQNEALAKLFVKWNENHITDEEFAINGVKILDSNYVKISTNLEENQE